jgi:DNA anti-recombination protein RmuC
MTEYEMPMEEQIKLLVKKVGALDEKFDAMDKKFDAVDKKFDAMDQKFDDKFTKIMVRLEDTHAVAKLGLEGVQGLRESMDEKFEAAAKTNADQTVLLKSLFVHVRKRVDLLERPKPRRRRS